MCHFTHYEAGGYITLIFLTDTVFRTFASPPLYNKEECLCASSKHFVSVVAHHHFHDTFSLSLLFHSAYHETLGAVMVIAGQDRPRHNDVTSLDGSTLPPGATSIADLPFNRLYHTAGLVNRTGELVNAW